MQKLKWIVLTGKTPNCSHLPAVDKSQSYPFPIRKAV